MTEAPGPYQWGSVGYRLACRTGRGLRWNLGGERPEQGSPDHTEDRRVRPDAERERRHRQRRESGRPRQRATRQPHVPHPSFHRPTPPSLVHPPPTHPEAEHLPPVPTSGRTHAIALRPLGVQAGEGGFHLLRLGRSHEPAQEPTGEPGRMASRRVAHRSASCLVQRRLDPVPEAHEALTGFAHRVERVVGEPEVPPGVASLVARLHHPVEK